MNHGGWSVGPSMALELDVALGFLVHPDGEAPPDLPEEALAVFRRIPLDWHEQSRLFLGRGRRWGSMMTLLATLAGVSREGDYSKATLAMRTLTLPVALVQAGEIGAQVGVEPDPGLPPMERLADLVARSLPATVAEAGLDLARQEEVAAGVQRGAAQAARFLRDGDLHAQFWHWLDRGYYEFYRPWRESKAEVMREQQERALLALGALSGDTPPALGWLPQQNALFSYSQLAEAVASGRLRVHFWVEPFGFFDYLHVQQPGCVQVSFAEPGHFFESFRNEAEAVAHRAKAVADPTRLAILRIIRHFSMDNTQIADYLGIARPTVSVHAKVLREAGLIDTTQEGRQARHRVRAAEVRRLFQDLNRFLDLPDEER